MFYFIRLRVTLTENCRLVEMCIRDSRDRPQRRLQVPPRPDRPPHDGGRVMNRLVVRLVISHLLVAVVAALATFLVVRQLAPALFDASLRVGQGGGPVSYTHLDVYKRQRQEC